MASVESLLECIADGVVLPRVEELSAETKQPIEVLLVVFFLGQRTERLLSVGVGNEGAVSKGEMRVLIKESIKGERLAFNAEAIFHGLSPGTGFSGFVLRGKLRKADESWQATTTSRSNRYNVWDWSKDLA